MLRYSKFGRGQYRVTSPPPPGRYTPTACPLSLHLRDLARVPRYLNTFRGQPAITCLDKPFTPTHKSSQAIATATGSGLHTCSRMASPCSCVARHVSGLMQGTMHRRIAPTTLSLHLRHRGLSLAPNASTRRPIIQKVRPNHMQHLRRAARTACRSLRFSRQLKPYWLSLLQLRGPSLSFAVLVHYRSWALKDRPEQDRPPFV